MREQAGWEPGKAPSPHGRAGRPLDRLIHPCCTGSQTPGSPGREGPQPGPSPGSGWQEPTELRPGSSWGRLAGRAGCRGKVGLLSPGASQHRGAGLLPGCAFKPMLPLRPGEHPEGLPPGLSHSGGRGQHSRWAARWAAPHFVGPPALFSTSPWVNSCGLQYSESAGETEAWPWPFSSASCAQEPPPSQDPKRSVSGCPRPQYHFLGGHQGKRVRGGAANGQGGVSVN